MALPLSPNALQSALGNLLAPDDTIPPDKSNQSGLSIAWKDAGGAIQSVRFDVVSSESHEALMQLTDHPVEIGANVVDNAREMPDTITIEGYVSNAPLPSNPGMAKILTLQSVQLVLPTKSLQPSLTSLVGAALDALDPPASGAMVQMTKDKQPNRVWIMHDTLTLVRRSRALVRVISSMSYSESMMITRVGAVRSLADGSGATFHVEVKRVRLVSALTVDAPQPTEVRGMIAAASGSKSTSEASDAATAKAKESFGVTGGKLLGLLH